MTARRLTLLAVAAGLLPLMLSGCGGEAGVVVGLHGLYVGLMDGDGQGPLRFFVARNGGLTGNLRIDPLCDGVVQITGTVGADGSVTFQGTACGISFVGQGTIQRAAPGSSLFVGAGTWTGDDGSRGTWDVDRRGATGSINL